VVRDLRSIRWRSRYAEPGNVHLYGEEKYRSVVPSYSSVNRAAGTFR
jgi:hypothetical protein